MKKILLAFIVLFGFTFCGEKSMQGGSGIEVSGAWVRLVPSNSEVTGGYLQLTNHSEMDRLQGASSDFAEAVEIHEMKESEGMMKMRKLDQGLELPSHKSVRLLPGGNHLMLIGLKKELKPGMKVPITLEFAKAQPLLIEFTVGEMSEATGDSHEHHNHD